MDKLTSYRQIIKKAISGYVELDNRYPDLGVESYMIADEQGDNYFWINLGWKNNRRVNSVYLFVRIRDGKIWIEEDRTEEGIATDLLEAGVPNEDIVLGFQPPQMRQYTEFAAA